ncbi:hypothetical protein [Microbulbifer aestuariivivens]|uniref:hypothetical protein n=1 Tax=Microbulbifer aestuariivivens TaxID=1908308 RepID=UPI0031ECD913
MRIIILICLTQLLTGCIGLAVGTFGTFESKQENTSLTKDEIIASRGHPDTISTLGKCEVITYYDGYSWSGVGAFVVVIPIPIFLPSGHDETRYYFIDGKSVAQVTEYGEVTGALGYACGSNECGFSAGPVNTDKIRKVEVNWCE